LYLNLNRLDRFLNLDKILTPLVGVANSEFHFIKLTVTLWEFEKRLIISFNLIIRTILLIWKVICLKFKFMIRECCFLLRLILNFWIKLKRKRMKWENYELLTLQFEDQWIWENCTEESPISLHNPFTAFNFNLETKWRTLFLPFLFLSHTPLFSQLRSTISDSIFISKLIWDT
jgi:hypothetical protein